MDIYVYNNQSDGMYLRGMTDSVISLRWTRRFFKGDKFEAVFPATQKNLFLIHQNCIIEVRGKYCGYITDFEIYRTNGEERISVKGVSLDGMLERRILAYNAPKDSLMAVLDCNAGSTALYTQRRFENTVFDDTVTCFSMFNDALRFRTLAEYVEVVGMYTLMSVKAKILHDTRPSIVFYGTYGKDRSVQQNKLPQVVFDEDRENIDDSRYTYGEDGAKDSLVAHSPAEYDAAKHIDVAEYTACMMPENMSRMGYAMHEWAEEIKPSTTYDMRPVSEDEVIAWTVLDPVTTGYTAEEVFKAGVKPITECFSADIIIGEDYRSKFDLGDIVTLRSKRWNMVLNKRITEICEYYGEDGTVKITATLGDPQKVLGDLLK